ncbi:hypothetical protein D6D19_01556 [Aureobasidium pullulans]|uniref:Uncharacterized protein n=1 Tax=Aureobasidium pullulans TaxID=5580 RepID=A0A4T0AXD2_AURPU|nr:hypothetical protein D6D19_01556 [Aureobasidium pullulans]TIA23365.1 hypothetical protein D6C81_02925 [Aureobasidium pullulans]
MASRSSFKSQIPIRVKNSKGLTKPYQKRRLYYDSISRAPPFSYDSATDMVLPQHTQLEEEVRNVEFSEPEESLNVPGPTVNSLLSEPQFTNEISELLSTVPKVSQLEHLVEERRARRSTTCILLNTIIQRNESLIRDIKNAEFTLSFLNEIAEDRVPHQRSSQRVVKKNSSLTEQGDRLVNASNSVFTSNNTLIAECQVNLRNDTEYHESGSNIKAPQNKDLSKENEDLVCFLVRLTPLLSALENFNDRLIKHLNELESHVKAAEAAMTQPPRTDSSSSKGFLGRLSCFH